MKVLIPSYRWPGLNPLDDQVWESWLDLASTTGGGIVANPASGPGAAPDPGWQDLANEARRAHALVFGYVALGYGAVDPLVAVELAERYMRWYHTDGIFFDEAPSGAGRVLRANDERRYVSLLARWCLLGRSGQKPQRCVFNPGAKVPGDWQKEYPLDRLHAVTWVLHEGPEMPADIPASPADSCAIVYAQADPQAAMAALDAQGWIWGFATSDTLPNPFDGQP